MSISTSFAEPIGRTSSMVDGVVNAVRLRLKRLELREYCRPTHDDFEIIALVSKFRYGA
jgi:hypothetical protein